MATHVRCNGCRDWFSAKVKVCPSCGHERPAHNSWLVVSNMNSHLYAQAEHAAANA